MNRSFMAGEYQYDPTIEIGRGAFGKVYLCVGDQNPNNRKCAKIITGGVDDPKVLREIDIMRKIKDSSLNNENVVKVFHVEKQEKQIVIVMEMCESDLKKEMDTKKKQGSSHTPSESLEVIKQMVNGYQLLYKEGIIHRDLKPANVLKKGNQYKLTDFGMGKIISKYEKLSTKVGSPAYAAPELFLAPTYTNSADVYSLGIMFYQLVFQDLPYTKIQSDQDLFMNFMRISTTPIDIKIEQKAGLTEEICNLINGMLRFDSNTRLTWEKLFQHFNFNVDLNQTQVKYKSPIKLIPKSIILQSPQQPNQTLQPQRLSVQETKPTQIQQSEVKPRQLGKTTSVVVNPTNGNCQQVQQQQHQQQQPQRLATLSNGPNKEQVLRQTLNQIDKFAQDLRKQLNTCINCQNEKETIQMLFNRLKGQNNLEQSVFNQCLNEINQYYLQNLRKFLPFEKTGQYFIEYLRILCCFERLIEQQPINSQMLQAIFNDYQCSNEHDLMEYISRRRTL